MITIPIAVLLGIAALYDARSYEVPLWIWIPAAVLCVPVVMGASVFQIICMLIPLVVIWYIRYRNLHGGADTLAFSAIAISTPTLAFCVPLVFVVMLLAFGIAYLFAYGGTRYPLLLSISFSYWLMISI